MSGEEGRAREAAAGRVAAELKRRRTVRRVRRERLTYLGRDALGDLWDRVTELEQEARRGVVIETGCALGGSAIVLAKAKRRARQMYVYDVFGMIPPPSDSDGPDVQARYEAIASGRSAGIGGDRYYGYEDDLLGSVRSSFERFGLPVERANVHLVKGRYEDTLRVDEPVALAHVDCDWYESVHVCLDRIWPRLAEGGVLVVDDYDEWSGCRLAVDEYFAGRGEELVAERRARLHIVKKTVDDG